jgi:hypothetical protein
MAAGGYLALFVIIGTRLGFAIAMKYFAMLIVAVSALLVIIFFVSAAEPIEFPSWPRYSPLSILIFSVSAFLITAAFVSSSYQAYRFTKKFLLMFLSTAPPCGFCVGLLSVIGLRYSSPGHIDYRILEGGVPFVFILVGYVAMILIGEWGLRFARRICAIPE